MNKAKLGGNNKKYFLVTTILLNGSHFRGRVGGGLRFSYFLYEIPIWQGSTYLQYLKQSTANRDKDIVKIRA